MAEVWEPRTDFLSTNRKIVLHYFLRLEKLSVQGMSEKSSVRLYQGRRKTVQKSILKIQVQDFGQFQPLE